MWEDWLEGEVTHEITETLNSVSEVMVDWQQGRVLFKVEKTEV